MFIKSGPKAGIPCGTSFLVKGPFGIDISASIYKIYNRGITYEEQPIKRSEKGVQRIYKNEIHCFLT